MSFTYDLSTNVGKVRLMIPDNDSTAYDLQDAEIEYFLEQEGNSVIYAAIACCQWLARKYAKQATFSADGMSFQASQRAQLFAERARELREQTESWGTFDIDREDAFSEASASEYTRRDRVIYIKA